MLNNEKNNLGMTAPEKNKVVQSQVERILTVFSKEIKKERKKLNISQEDLAYFADVSVDTVRRYESGTMTQASFGAALSIAAALKISFDDILAIAIGTKETQKSLVENAIKTIEMYVNNK